LIRDICKRMLSKYIYSLLLLIITVPCSAQLCQGSLGDPIINITFGSGGNPGSPLSAAATGYSFVSNDCPNDGFYTVRSNSSSCFANSWHTVPNDHTGNGYFMLVNAALQPSAFYVDTVRGLCGSSTYEFAAWILNIILPSSCNGASSQPDLTFFIESTSGTVLASYQSGKIPPTASPTWNQYGFFFTTPPAGSDIVLRIVNNAAGGCGNDLALDDITFRPCGPLLTPSVSGQTANQINICQGTNRSFTFNCTVSGGFNNPSYIWQQRFNGSSWTDIAGANSTSLTRNFPPTSAIGNYEYRLSVAETGNLGSAQCRISSAPVSVVVNANPVITAGNSGPVCAGSTATLNAGGAFSYSWIGPGGYTSSSSNALVPNIQSSQAGTYSVTGTNSFGCIGNATTSIVVNPVPIATVTPSAPVLCQGDSVRLLAAGGIRYSWLPSTGLSSDSVSNPVAKPLTSFLYMVIVSNSLGCADTAQVPVKVYERALASAGPDKLIVKGQTTTLNGSITGSYKSFTWSPSVNISNSQLLTPLVNPANDTTYVLDVLSNNGCGTSSDSVSVRVFNGIFIPNAFTPNGDGINSTWIVPALNAFPGFELRVFDRFGQVVFENKNFNVPWNGKFKGQDLSAGVYVYVIDLKKAPGILKGTLMILR
jgi:gliding motility-associated-like protein